MCCKVVVIPRPGPNYRKRKAVRLRRREDICVVKVRGVWACTRRDGECCGSATWSAGRRSVKKGDGESTSDLSTERRARCGGHGVYMYLPSYGGNGGNTDIHDLKGHFQRQALAASGLPLLAANPPLPPAAWGASPWVGSRLHSRAALEVLSGISPRPNGARILGWS